MATLQIRNGSYRILFCYGKRRLTFTIGEVSEREAENWVAEVDQTLLRIAQGLLKVPPEVDVTSFVKNRGKVEEVQPEVKPPITFKELIDAYLAAHDNGAMEANSLDTIRMHLRHVAGTLGDKFELDNLTLDDLQRQVNRRSAKKYRGRPLSPVTLQKELASFRAAWNWGVQGGRLSSRFRIREEVLLRAKPQ